MKHWDLEPGELVTLRRAGQDPSVRDRLTADERWAAAVRAGHNGQKVLRYRYSDTQRFTFEVPENLEWNEPDWRKRARARLVWFFGNDDGTLRDRDGWRWLIESGRVVPEHRFVIPAARAKGASS